MYFVFFFEEKVKGISFIVWMVVIWKEKDWGEVFVECFIIVKMITIIKIIKMNM